MNLSNEKNTLLNTVSRLAVDAGSRMAGKFVTRGAMAAVALTVVTYSLVDTTPAVASCSPATAVADGTSVTCTDTAAGGFDADGYDGNDIRVFEDGAASAGVGIDLGSGTDGNSNNNTVFVFDLFFGGTTVGTVTGTAGDGIFIDGDGNTVNNGFTKALDIVGGGKISGTADGIDIDGINNTVNNFNNGNGTNSGVISGGGNDDSDHGIEVSGGTSGNVNTINNGLLGTGTAYIISGGTPGSATVDGGDGINAEGWTTVNNGTLGEIHGEDRGIDFTGTGGATLTVKNDGDIIGDIEDGIRIVGDNSIVNYSGDGTVKGGATAAGIDISPTSDDVKLTVTFGAGGTGLITGGANGIELGDTGIASNNTIIKISGKGIVEGNGATNADGIHVFDSSGTDITIDDGATIQGKDDGIDLGSDSKLLVDGASIVKGDTDSSGGGDGIQGNDDNNIHVTGGSKVYGDPGILVDDNNVILIDGGAEVNSDPNDGINVDDNNTITIGGAGGAGYVKTTGGGDGISLTDAFNGPGETNDNTVTIGKGGQVLVTGSGDGIVVGNVGDDNDDNSVTVEDGGLVDVESGDGIVVNGQDGGADNNTVTIEDGGVVDAGGDGVRLLGDDQVTTGLDAIAGGDFFGDSDGSGNDLDNDGIIRAGDDGVLVSNTNSDVRNQGGEIYAGDDGVRFTTIHTDAVDGDTSFPGEFESGYQSDSESLIVAGRDGIHYDNYADDAFDSDFNAGFGDVDGLGEIDDPLDLLFGIKGYYPEVVDNFGTIEAGRHGIRVNDDFAVVNGEDAVIVAGGLPGEGATGGDGIHADANNFILNQGTIATGEDANGDSHGIELIGESNTVTNEGIIDTRGDQDIDIIDNATLEAGPDVKQDDGAGGDGIHAGVDGLTLGGLVKNGYDQQEIYNGNIIIAADDGIDVQSGLGIAGGEQLITNDDEATITANDDGIVAENYNIIVNEDGGVINADDDNEGGGDGINIGHSNVVTNDGDINSKGGNGIVMGGQQGPFSFGNAVYNTATGDIVAGEDGIQVNGEENYIENNGNIKGGTNGVALNDEENNFVSTAGTIEGGTGAGIYSDEDNDIELSGTTVVTTTLGKGGDGIVLEDDNSLEIEDGVTVTGDDDGLVLEGDDNDVDIEGGAKGFEITGRDGDGIEITGDSNTIDTSGDVDVQGGDDGIDINGGNTNAVDIDGDVAGEDDGIVITNGTGNVVLVGGNVTGDSDDEGGGDGVEIFGGGTNTVNVTGDITGDPGVLITNSSNNIVSGASITGNEGGVVISNGNNNTVTSTVGSINGDDDKNFSGTGVDITGTSNVVKSADDITGYIGVDIDGNLNEVSAVNDIVGQNDGVIVDGNTNVVTAGGAITGTDADGLEIDGDNNQVTAGSVSGGDNAIDIDGDSNDVTVNGDITADTGLGGYGSGVLINGTNNTVSGEDIGVSGTGQWGVAITGNTNTVTADSISGYSEDGVEIDGDNNTVDSAGAISSTNADGVDIDGDSNNVDAGSITGGESGVVISGNTNDVDVDGLIDGNGDEGVAINGNNNTVDADGVQGFWDGVDISGGSNNVVTIGASGIDGENGQGVDITGNDNSVSTTGDIDGGTDGVAIDGDDNDVHADGTITGETDEGVQIDGDENDVSAGAITGYWDGVDINGDDNNIEVDGAITGTNGDGVDISGDQNVVEADGINGGDNGIVINGNQNFVDVGSTVNATNGHGVWFESGTGNIVDLKGVTVTAGEDGVHVDEPGNSFPTDGDTVINAGDDGIDVEYGGVVGDNEVIIWNGTINADDDGIHATGGYFTIINNGTINADVDDDNVGDGIEVGDNNNVKNSSTGTITGWNGIVADDNNIITNDGLIDVENDGIQVDDDNEVYNNGTINAGDDGIQAGDKNYIENNSSLTINADDDGINVGNDNEVVNNGVINADFDDNNDGTGIVAVAGNKVTNNGDITGWNGVDIDGSNVLLNAKGATIDAENIGVIANFNNAITNDGEIDGGSEGVNLDFFNSLTNNGDIFGGNIGVYGGEDNFVTNNVGATIDSNDTGVMFGEDGNDLVNYGSVTGYNAVEIFGDFNTVDNKTTGSIDGSWVGIWIEEGDYNDVTNSGSIEGGIDGIFVYNGAYNTEIDNLSGGTIHGEDYAGIEISNSDATDINNAGTISGEDFGIAIWSGDDTSIVNSNLITGGEGIYANNSNSLYIWNSGTISGTDDDGIDLDNESDNADIINYGTIIGAEDGIDIEDSSGTTITNYNTVKGTSSDGVQIDNGGFTEIFNNGGTISGDDDGIDNDDGNLFVGNEGGIISGADGDGIDSNRDSSGFYDTTVYNYDDDEGNGSLIIGEDDGIDVGGEGFYLFNDVGSVITGQQDDGIHTHADRNDIYNLGVISGADTGITDGSEFNGEDGEDNETYISNGSTGLITGSKAGYYYEAGPAFNDTVQIDNHGVIEVTGDGVLPTPLVDDPATKDVDESKGALDYINGEDAVPVAAIDTSEGGVGLEVFIFNWGEINGANEFSAAVVDDPATKDVDETKAAVQLTNRFAILGGESNEYIANFAGGTINGDVFTQAGDDVLALEIGSTLNGDVNLGQTLETAGVLGLIKDDPATKDVDESAGGTAVGFVSTKNVDTGIDTVILFGEGYQDLSSDIAEAEILYVNDQLTQGDIYSVAPFSYAPLATQPVLENQPTPLGTWSLNGKVTIDGTNVWTLIDVDGNGNGVLDEETDTGDDTLALINGTIATVVDNGRLNIGATTITEILGEPTDEEEGELEPSTFVISTNSTAVLTSPVVDVWSGGTLGGHGTIVTNPGANGGNGGVNLTGAVQGDKTIFVGVDEDNIIEQDLEGEARGSLIIGTTTVDFVTQKDDGTVTDKTKGDGTPDFTVSKVDGKDVKTDTLVTWDDAGNLYPDIKLPAGWVSETSSGPFDFTTDSPRYATLAPGDEITRIGTLTVVGNVKMDDRETGTTTWTVKIADDPATKDVDESKGGTATKTQTGRTVVTNWGSQFQADLKDDGKGDLLLVKKSGVTSAFTGSTFDITGPGPADKVTQDAKGVVTDGTKGDGINDFKIDVVDAKDVKSDLIYSNVGKADGIPDGVAYKVSTVLDGHASVDGRLDIRLDGEFVDLVDNSQTPTIVDPDKTGCGDDPDDADSCIIPNPLYAIPDGIADVDAKGVAKNNADFSNKALVWDIIIAEGGVTGKFDELGFDGGPNDGAVVTRYDDPETPEDEELRVALLKAYLQYLPDRVRIISIPEFGSLPSLDLTLNQQQTADYLDSLTKYGLNSDALHAAIAIVGTVADIPAALDALHPEWYNAFNEVGFSIARGAEQQAYIRTIEAQGFSGGQQNRVVMNVGDDSAVGSSASDRRATFWLAGSWGNANVDDGSDEGWLEYKYETLTGYAGFDYLINPNFLLGIMGGFSNSDVDAKNGTKEGDVDSWQVSGYVSYFTSSWFLNAGGGIGDMNIESIRDIQFGSGIGNISQIATADYDGDITFFYGKGGYSFDMGNSGWKLSPELALSYAKVKQDGFSETGTGNAPVFLLDVDGQSVKSLRGTAQLRLSKTFLAGNGGGWMPYVRVGIANEFEDDLRPITSGFQGAPGTSFTVFGQVPRQTTVIFGAGVTGKVTEMFSLYLDYSGEIGGSFTEHVISGGVRLHF